MRGPSGVDTLHIVVIKSLFGALCNYTALCTLLQSRKAQRPGRLGRVKENPVLAHTHTHTHTHTPELELHREDKTFRELAVVRGT